MRRTAIFSARSSVAVPFAFLTYFLSLSTRSISVRMSVIFVSVWVRGTVSASSEVYSALLGPSMRRLGKNGG